MRLTIVDAGGERSTREYTVIAQVDEATTVADLTAAVGVDLAPVCEVLPEQAATQLVSDTALRSGSRVHAVSAAVPSRAASPPPIPSGAHRIEIIGGRFAGNAVRLPFGTRFSVGSGHGSWLRLPDGHLSETHFEVQVGPASSSAAAPSAEAQLVASVMPLAGRRVLINDTEVTERTPVTSIDIVQAGASLFRIGVEPSADAGLSRASPGMRAFNRPSRITAVSATPRVTVPPTMSPTATSDANHEESPPIPWVAAAIPLALGITMALVFARPIMLLMAVASPLMIATNYFGQRKHTRRRRAQRDAARQEERDAAETHLSALARAQRDEGWRDHPDPLTVIDIATKPLARLWERRHSDADALTVRVGVGSTKLRAHFEHSASGVPEQEVRVTPAPVTVDLARGPVGLAGPPDTTRALARSMLASLATLRSPRELRIVVLCADGSEREWGWIAWLPHSVPLSRQGSAPAVLIGNTEATRLARLDELSSLSRENLREQSSQTRSEAAPPLHTVVLIDDARSMRDLPGMVSLLTRSPANGVHVIALDTDRTRLPEECRSVVFAGADGVGGDAGALGSVESAEIGHEGVLIDALPLAAADRLARSLCSIEHVSGTEEETTLPTSARLVERIPTPEAVLLRWRSAPSSTRAVVGMTASGEYAVDLARDGPHALVAGTTGAGKSEFLQTLIASLALSNSPERMHFLLVDYKGGAAFADCARLPHTVGMVTNLDAHETVRALASLNAELKRRERILRDLGASNLDTAWNIAPATASREGLARLVIVVDEFAELKAELPEFIAGLVRVARVGRSLGVHLVLATQRPSGVVTPEMQSNINLRVALRVADRADSIDVLGSADASRIPPALPGRGYVRSTGGAPPIAFQTARVAGRVVGSVAGSVADGPSPHSLSPPPAPLPIAHLTWDSLGETPVFASRPPGSGTAAPPAIGSTPERASLTDLQEIVAVSIEAASLGEILPQRSPWLEPLPEVLPLRRLVTAPDTSADIVLGLEDQPEHQAQLPVTWNATTGGHLAFVGGARSGRTSALRTFLAQAVLRYSPSDLHLYLADFGTGALGPLVAAPHCGAVVTKFDHARFPRLMRRLVSDLTERQETLSATGVGSIHDQRARVAPASALAHSVFAIDGWEHLVASLDFESLAMFRDQLIRLLREGPAVGIHVMVAADRTFPGDKIANEIDHLYLLPMRDRNDYRAAGVTPPSPLPSPRPGRALFGPEASEMQFAIISETPSSNAQDVVLHEAATAARDFYAAFPELESLPQAFTVDALPARITLPAALKLPAHDAASTDSSDSSSSSSSSSSSRVVCGVGGDTLSRVELPWRRNAGCLITGSRNSGKSSALAAILVQLHDAGAPLVVVSLQSKRASLLLAKIAHTRAITVIDDPQTTTEHLCEIVDAFEERSPRGPLTLIIDDAERIASTPLEAAIVEVSSRACLAISVNTDSGDSIPGGSLLGSSQIGGPPLGRLYAIAQSYRQGVVLMPGHPREGTAVFGTPIPQHLFGAPSQGSGVAFTGESWVTVRVPEVLA